MSKRRERIDTIALTIFGIVAMALLIVFLWLMVKAVEYDNRSLESELIGIKRELSESKRNQLELEARVSTVQAAVVETKVALSTSKSAETTKANVTKPVGKPVVNVRAKETHETNYVDPVSTFIVGGALQIGKAVITNGGTIN